MLSHLFLVACACLGIISPVDSERRTNENGHELAKGLPELEVESLDSFVKTPQFPKGIHEAPLPQGLYVKLEKDEEPPDEHMSGVWRRTLAWIDPESQGRIATAVAELPTHLNAQWTIRVQAPQRPPDAEGLPNVGAIPMPGETLFVIASDRVRSATSRGLHQLKSFTITKGEGSKNPLFIFEKPDPDSDTWNIYAGDRDKRMSNDFFRMFAIILKDRQLFFRRFLQNKQMKGWLGRRYTDSGYDDFLFNANQTDATYGARGMQYFLSKKQHFSQLDVKQAELDRGLLLSFMTAMDVLSFFDK